MTLRSRLFLVFGTLMGLIVGAEWALVTALTADLEDEVAQIAFDAGSQVLESFFPSVEEGEGGPSQGFFLDDEVDHGDHNHPLARTFQYVQRDWNEQMPEGLEELEALALEGEQLREALAPLHDAFGLKACHVTTLQSVSGAGGRARSALEEQLRLCLPRMHGSTGPSPGTSDISTTIGPDGTAGATSAGSPARESGARVAESADSSGGAVQAAANAAAAIAAKRSGRMPDYLKRSSKAWRASDCVLGPRSEVMPPKLPSGRLSSRVISTASFGSNSTQSLAAAFL